MFFCTVTALTSSQVDSSSASDELEDAMLSVGDIKMKQSSVLGMRNVGISSSQKSDPLSEDGYEFCC